MARYIDADKLLTDELMHILPIGCGRSSGRVVVFVEDIEKAPTADVVEVVHASWKYGKACGQPGYYCTKCGAGFTGENAEWIAKEHNYCPKCGAKMDGERREDDPQLRHIRQPIRAARHKE